MVNLLSMGRGETRVDTISAFLLSLSGRRAASESGSVGVAVGVGPGDAASFDFFLTLRDLVMKLDMTDLGRLCFLLTGLAVPCGA